VHQISESFFSNGLYPSVFHQDPHYYIMGRSHPWKQRAVYSASRVVLTQSDGKVHECVVEAGRPFVIGRSDRASLPLDWKPVSRSHCQLELLPSGVVEVVDLESQNGTKVNGRRIGRA